MAHERLRYACDITPAIIENRVEDINVVTGEDRRT